MIVGIKDLLKLVSISIVCFCAVFVSTFLINFYLDLSAVENISEQVKPLYDAQLATAQLSSGVCGGFLGVIAVVMLVFYIKLYINSHTVQLGILKSLGYSDMEIAVKFWVFGLSVLLGTGLGYGCGHAIMPYIYGKLLYGGLPDVPITYHVGLLFAFVVAPTVIYSLISCLIAYIYLRRPVSELLRGRAEKVKLKPEKKEKERTFLKEMFIKCVTTKKLLVFFVAFGSFCFSGMIQMSVSVRRDMGAADMANILLVVGITLAVVTMLISIASLVNANAENVSIMKAYGYNLWQCTLAVFGGCVPFALLGFAVGTGYQFGMLSIMIKLIYKNMENMPDYTFDVPVMFITLAAFVVFTCAIVGFYMLKMMSITLKQAANE